MHRSRLRKHIRVVLRYARIKFKELTEYKVDFFVFMMTMSLWFISMFFYWRLILGPDGTIYGWTLPQLFLLPIFAEFIWAFFGLVFGGFYSLWRSLTDGGFDKYLARPMSGIIGHLSNHMDMWSFARVFLSLILIFIVALSFPAQVSIVGIFLAIILATLGAVAFGTIVGTFFLSAFWIGENAFIDRIVDGIDRWARYPLDLFPKAFHYVFIFVFPIFFVTIWPVKLSFGGIAFSSAGWMMLGALGLIIFWGVLFSLILSRGLKKYESGGG
jgi:ABC-2 type transport system permease protein